MQVGIVGSGIAGLAAAWILSSRGYHCTVLEKSDRPGLAANSSESPIDIPLRLCNRELWPNLFKLYSDANIQLERVEASQSYSSLQGQANFTVDLRSFFTAGLDLISNGSKRRYLSQLGELRSRGIIFLNQLSTEKTCSITFREFLNDAKIEMDLISNVIYPVLSSTVLTCSYKTLDSYPADLVLDAMAKISGAFQPGTGGILRASMGADEICKQLMATDGELLLSHQVLSIEQRRDLVQVAVLNLKTGVVKTLGFDQVVVATQANHVAKLLGKFTGCSMNIFNSVGYENVHVVLHRDSRLMPRSREDWCTFNMISTANTAMCSVWCNQFFGDQRLGEHDIFQTINAIVEPEEDKVVCQRVLQRPVVDHRSFELWDALDRYHQRDDCRIWFVGSYASPGVPLLESGVVSAKKVVDRIQKLAGSPAAW